MTVNTKSMSAGFFNHKPTNLTGSRPEKKPLVSGPDRLVNGPSVRDHKHQQLIHKQKKRVYVDVGGIGDCGFRSIAAGLVDNFISKGSISEQVLAVVLHRYLHYFPKNRSLFANGEKPYDQFAQLIRNLTIAELVFTLSYTLRQLSVDELVSHPELYQGAFADVHEHTLPEAMRKTSTWIDESAIAALANVLNLPIHVQSVNRYASLPMQLVYNQEASHQSIHIRLQSGHYIPSVVNAELFKGLKAQFIYKIEPCQIPELTKSMEQILEEIRQDNERLLMQYESHKNRLSTMVLAGELNKQDLLDIYIRGMRYSDYLKGRIEYVGLEHGNQNFFDAIINAKQGKQNPELPCNNYDEQVVSELVHALARAISIGHINASDVFDFVDSKDQSTAVRNRS